MVQPDGSVIEVDRTAELIELFHKAGIDALITIGGDGSMTIANALWEQGLRIVGVPKTIDNDLDSTEVTFGFDTAVSFATECLDRLHTTAASHNRVMVVEVMGRYAGWIALHAGMAGGRSDSDSRNSLRSDLCRRQNQRPRQAQQEIFQIVVVAEGAKPRGGQISVLGKEVAPSVSAVWAKKCRTNWKH